MCHCSAIVAYATLHHASAYYYFEEEIVVCSPPEMYQGNAKKVWGSITFAVIVMSLIVYYAVWRKLRHAATFSQDRRLFRSIFAVMSVIILGWLSSMLTF
ncbi:hypothetical protein PMAYCL1PPCAC_17163, partial [Pristionchus mayeri]